VFVEQVVEGGLELHVVVGLGRHEGLMYRGVGGAKTRV